MFFRHYSKTTEMEISMGFDRKRKGETQRKEKTQKVPGSNPAGIVRFDEH